MLVTLTIRQKKIFTKFKEVSFKSEKLDKNIRLLVSNAALRTVDFKGGLDKFLKSKKINTYQRVKKLKISLAGKN